MLHFGKGEGEGEGGRGQTGEEHFLSFEKNESDSPKLMQKQGRFPIFLRFLSDLPISSSILQHRKTYVIPDGLSRSKIRKIGGCLVHIENTIRALKFQLMGNDT